ncbi:hypothetical protein [Eisenbergiella sp.]
MKLLIFGIVASGKTTLAKTLSCRLGIPWYEGDCIAWVQDKETRYKRTPQEQLEVICELDAEGDWIVEGCYRESQKPYEDKLVRVKSKRQLLKGWEAGGI